MQRMLKTSGVPAVCLVNRPTCLSSFHGACQPAIKSHNMKHIPMFQEFMTCPICD